MTGSSTAAAAAQQSRRVLVVEDEVLIAMVIEDMLDILGYQLAGTAASFAEAASAVDAGGFDLVIADVNLGSESIFPLADALLAAGVPLILATGSHRDTLPQRFAAVPVIEKPYLIGAVEAALARL